MIDAQTVVLLGLTFTSGWSLMELRKKQTTKQAREWLDASEANNATHHENLRKYAEKLVSDHKACSACGQVFNRVNMQEVEHWLEDPYDRDDPYARMNILLLRRMLNPNRHREHHRTEWFCTKHKKPFTIQLRTLGRYQYRFDKDGKLDTGPGPRYFNRVPINQNPGWEEYIPKEPRK